MAIKTLPLAPPELGRVRLGDTEPVLDKQTGQPVIDKRTGRPKTRPVKGWFLRFSSNDDVVLKAIASQHGGTVERWEGGEQTWELTTESDSIDVFLAPKPIECWYETWGDAGCKRRCDGERCTFLDNGPDGAFLNTGGCRCLADDLTPGDTKGGACAVTVRIWLVLPDVPGIGVWMCTSHSVYAAMELPGQVAVLQALMPPPDPAEPLRLIPATFAIEKRTVKKPYEKYARDYIVPVLRVRKSLAQLMSPTNGNGGAIERDDQPAIGAPRPALDAGTPIPAAGSSGPPAAPEGAPMTPAGRSGEARSTPKPAQSSSSRAAPPAAAGSAGPSPVFIRNIRMMAKRMWPDVSEADRERRLDSITEEVTDHKALAEVTGPEAANAVLKALGEAGKGAA